MNSVRSPSISAFIAAKPCAPGFRPITLRDMLEVIVEAADQAAQHRVGIAAAQHHATPISVLERRIAAFAISGVTPSRPIRCW